MRQSFSDVSTYFVHIILVWFEVLSGHLLGKAAHSVDDMFFVKVTEKQ